jgi:polyribonucleotide nucleotidyltransferase
MALNLEGKTSTLELNGQTLTLESGKIAKQADGSALVRLGDTVVLVTVVAAKEKKEGLDFFPLTVEYQEKLYAAGRIPGSFFRREGRPTERRSSRRASSTARCDRSFPRASRTRRRSSPPSCRWTVRTSRTSCR